MIFPIILTIILCALGIVTAFFKKLPAALIAFAGMLVPGLTGAEIFPSGTLWFWGIAAAIVTANLYLSELPPLPALRYYTLGGSLTGCILGALFIYPVAGVIIGAFGGAALGFMAFRCTPAGRMNASLARTLSIFAEVASPGATAFCIAILTLSYLK